MSRNEHASCSYVSRCPAEGYLLELLLRAREEGGGRKEEKPVKGRMDTTELHVAGRCTAQGGETLTREERRREHMAVYPSRSPGDSPAADRETLCSLRNNDAAVSRCERPVVSAPCGSVS